MRQYPMQPEEGGYIFDDDINPHIPANPPTRILMAKRVILEVLAEELPSCSTNKWFIPSVHFANMIDKIVERAVREII